MGRFNIILALITVLMAVPARAGVTEAQAALDTENYTLAIQLASASLRQPGLSTEDTNRLRIVRGKARFATNRFNDAIDDFTAAIDTQPSGPDRERKRLADTYLARGNAYFRTGKYHAAAEDFKQSVACDPDNAVAHFSLGQAYSGMRLTDEALKSYSAAIRLKPDYAEAYGSRAASYGNQQEDKAALRDYDMAIQLDPKEARYYGNRATIYMGMKRYDEGEADLDKSISLDPADFGSYLNRAELHAMRGEIEAASADLDTGERLLNDFYDKHPESRDTGEFSIFMQLILDRIKEEVAKAKEKSDKN